MKRSLSSTSKAEFGSNKKRKKGEVHSHRKNFGQVRNAFIRLYDRNSNHEIAKYDLEEDFSTETALEFGRLYKKDGSWRFKAVGTGYNAGLQGFVDKFIP